MTLAHGQTEQFSRRIIGAAIEVHRHLGPGLLESNYEECLCLELTELGLKFRQQVAIPVIYKGHTLKNCYRPDLIVENAVIVEVKCVERLAPVHTAQVMTYLKHTGIHLGLLFNFNTAVLMNGMKRIVL